MTKSKEYDLQKDIIGELTRAEVAAGDDAHEKQREAIRRGLERFIAPASLGVALATATATGSILGVVASPLVALATTALIAMYPWKESRIIDFFEKHGKEFVQSFSPECVMANEKMMQDRMQLRKESIGVSDDKGLWDRVKDSISLIKKTIVEEWTNIVPGIVRDMPYAVFSLTGVTIGLNCLTAPVGISNTIGQAAFTFLTVCAAFQYCAIANLDTEAFHEGHTFGDKLTNEVTRFKDSVTSTVKKLTTLFSGNKLVSSLEDAGSIPIPAPKKSTKAIESDTHDHISGNS